MIDLAVTPQHLYSARHIVAKWTTSDGSAMEDRTGTGFFVVHEGAVFLVTNRHLLDLEYVNKKYVGATLSGLSVRGFDLCEHRSEHEATYCFESPSPIFGRDNDDVAVIPASGAKICDGQHCAISNYYDSELLARRGEFESDDRAESIVATDVLAICGFPGLDGQVQQERPTAMIGFIASDPRYRPNPLPQLEEGRDIRSENVILYQGFSRSGSSGSPMLAVQRGLHLGGALSGPPSRSIRLVGINAGRIKGSSSHPSALSYGVRSDSILETIERAAATV